MNYKQLIEHATKSKEKAYVKYSNFRVGAAVLFEDGKIYTGANIENASYGATICAERVAITKGISEGSMKIKAISVNSDEDEIIYPCGICRQVISEFSNDDTEIICSNNKGDYEISKLKDILPHRFKLL